MSTGFSFGVPAATTSATPVVGFNVPSTSAPATAPPTASGGFSFGNLGQSTANTTTATVSFNLGSSLSTSTATTTTASGLGGFSFSGGTTATPAAGFGATPILGSTTAGISTATTSTTSTLGKPTLGLGIGSLTTSIPATTGLGGTITTSTVGLGGVDPATISTTSGGKDSSGKISDGKAVKETQVPDVIIQTVENFNKLVKEERGIRENIARMSPKPMYKVQEDVVGLKHLLSDLSNCLQRNACAVGKLKGEMTQELKAAEMAQRTKDIPPGLQYENTAPTEYFQKLVERFEVNMQSYRQQIETLESHLDFSHQTNRLTPNDLVTVMKKLHEAFVALAAQVYEVHQAVKTQKEHYLNFQRVFHGETKDIFENQRKTQAMSSPKTREMMGPSPFSGMTNAAAIAMASALTRTQQPPGPPAVGLTTNTLGGVGATPGFGATPFASGTPAVGGSLFGGGTATTSATGFGFGTPAQPATQTSSLFASAALKTTGLPTTTTGTGGFSFGTPPVSTPSLFGFGTPGQTPIVGPSTPQFGVAASTNQPFQLGKPPVGGTKKGKR